jgi:hypothetical protein
LRRLQSSYFTTLVDESNNTFPEESLDPEGIVLTSSNTLYISSEGNTEELVNPFINEFSLEGEQLQELEIPAKFFPTADQSSGIRDNLAFESLTIDPAEKPNAYHASFISNPSNCPQYKLHCKYLKALQSINCAIQVTVFVSKDLISQSPFLN